MPGNVDTSLQGEFGEQWLRTVAVGQGLLHGNPDSRDLIKADVSITHPSVLGATRNPSVWVQVKTTHSARLAPDGSMTYDLDVETYNWLRLTDHQTRRILVVANLSEAGDNVVIEDGGTLLRGHVRWASLEGLPESQNSATQAVTLPADQTLSRTSLISMLTRYGCPRSTAVPDVDEWEVNK